MVISNEQLDRTLADELQQINDRRVESVLKEVESNFRKNIRDHIQFHKSLEQQALKLNDHRRASYHAIRLKVYQQILDNYTLSNSSNGR